MQKNRAPRLDRFDLRILALYQADTRQPAQAIADAVGLSAAAVQRRLQRLRADGVIEREAAQLSPKALGLPVTCIVAIELDRERAGDLDRFRARMLAEPLVQQCYYTTGNTDYLLIVLVPDMESYEAFARRTLLADANVRSFTTHVVLERIKVALDLPLAHAPAARPED